MSAVSREQFPGSNWEPDAPGEGEHAEQGGVEVARVVVALDAAVLAAQLVDVARLADRRHGAHHRSAVRSSVVYWTPTDKTR